LKNFLKKLDIFGTIPSFILRVQEEAPKIGGEKMKKVFGLVLSIVFLFALGFPAPSFSQALRQEEEAVKEVVSGFLETHWQLLLNLNAPLENYYDLSSPQALESMRIEREKVEMRYLKPARDDGLIYTGVVVHQKIQSLSIVGDRAVVKTTVDVEYTSYFPKGPDTQTILSKEAGLEFEITLIKRGEKWKILKNDYLEIWERPDPWPNWHPAPDISSNSNKLNSPMQRINSNIKPNWYLYYNRSGAIQYTDTWWNSSNSKYVYFPDSDCANYVSQCCYEGGQALMAWRSPYVWWYNFTQPPSYSSSWTVAPDQAYHLSNNTDVDEMRGSFVSQPSQLQIGDIIYYDWNPIDHINHAAIVVQIVNGVPFVNAHSINQYHVHWNMGAAATYFFHVTDWFWVN